MKNQIETKTPVKKINAGTSNVKTQIAHSAEGYPLLGNCIYWSFSEMKMPTDQFREMVVAAGLDEKIIQKPSLKSSIIAALESLMDGTKLKDRHKVVEDKEMTVWVIVDLIVDSYNQDVSTKTETKVYFYKKSKTYKIESTPEIKARLESLISEFEMSHTTSQIRSTALHILFEECQGVAVRESGGVYFVPSTYQAQFEKLKVLFEKVRDIGACSVDVIPVINTADAAKAMWKALTAEVNAEIASMKEDIASLKDNPSDRQREIRFTKMGNLKTKIEMYALLFNETSKDLENQLEGVKNLFLEHISK